MSFAQHNRHRSKLNTTLIIDIADCVLYFEQLCDPYRLITYICTTWHVLHEANRNWWLREGRASDASTQIHGLWHVFFPKKNLTMSNQTIPILSGTPLVVFPCDPINLRCFEFLIKPKLMHQLFVNAK